MGLKELFSKAKDKVNQTIEKSNIEYKKNRHTQNIVIYSKPVFGGFVTKKAFLEEEQKLLFPIEDFDKDTIQEKTIIGVEDDLEYYVITEVGEDVIIKTVEEDGKTYSFDCYEVKYNILNDAFTEDVDGLPFYELTVEQEKLLNEIKIKIEANNLALKSKKEFCLHLWELFVECIEYQKKDHYIVIAFSRIATEYVEDYSTYLIQLFA